MSPTATILLVEDDVTTLAVLERVLTRDGSYRVVTARDGREGWTLAQAEKPDLIVSDFEMPLVNGFELCRLVKNDPATASAMFVVLTAYGDVSHKVEGLGLGVDDYLTKPIEVPELVARVRAMLRIKELVDRTRTDQATLGVLHSRLEQSFEHLLTVLVYLLDLRVPGAAQRGQRLAAVARALATRLEVPERYLPDLEMAARLHEIGRVGGPHGQAGGADADRPVMVGEASWTYLLDAATILRQVDRLEPVAELVQQMGENWDGTGLPGHRRQGQIPLRSRILRVLVDFFALLGERSGVGALEDVSPRIAQHAGTWYDPSVVAQLEVLIAEAPATSLAHPSRQVLVSSLAKGMVLGKDLVTSSGVKLLARGATLTEAMREIIVRRHLIDPIVGGVWVER